MSPNWYDGASLGIAAPFVCFFVCLFILGRKLNRQSCLLKEVVREKEEKEEKEKKKSN